jgi:malonate-semialdehyde dehydrogenase (acetylating) / methylmalonate-semialdehyde dehydrogenase
MAQAAEAVKTLKHYVGGGWVDLDSAGALDVTNPATGQAIGRVPLATPAGVDRAVRTAHEAFPAWRATPPLNRARPFFKLREIMEARFDELARTITREHGKTLDDSRGEVRRAIENVETACGIPTLMMGYGLEDGAAAGIDEEVVRQPLGVFAAVCPFNFPAMVPFWFWPYAVACGDTYVVKPSEQVPMSMSLVAEMVDQIGLPSGVFNVVHGDRATVEALLDHPLVRGVSFVGSTPVARAVYARGAEHGKRVQAQGGAKNVLVVMPDANVEKTVDNVVGSSFGAAGQRCLANSILVTVGAARERVLPALREAVAKVRVGDGLEAGVGMGPVISDRAKERIVGYIEQGAREGARLTVDGRDVPAARGPGSFVGPTIFEDVRPDMKIAQDEIFGPVLSVIHVGSLEEAIKLIEDSPYGNAASIFTNDGAAARKFRYQVPTGNVGINVGVAAPMAYFPFSGAKESFFGTLHGQGKDAIDFFTEKKVVITRWFDSPDTAGHHGF